MTNEEAKRFFEHQLEVVKSGRTNVACMVAVHAIEKQIPTKPTLIEDKMYMCPTCYNNLMFKYKIYPTVLNEKIGLRFCLGCGQAIDWGEVDG